MSWEVGCVNSCVRVILFSLCACLLVGAFDVVPVIFSSVGTMHDSAFEGPALAKSVPALLRSAYLAGMP